MQTSKIEPGFLVKPLYHYQSDVSGDLSDHIITKGVYRAGIIKPHSTKGVLFLYLLAYLGVYNERF